MRVNAAFACKNSTVDFANSPEVPSITRSFSYCSHLDTLMLLDLDSNVERVRLRSDHTRLDSEEGPRAHLISSGARGNSIALTF